jgi:hypothetical protein
MKEEAKVCRKKLRSQNKKEREKESKKRKREEVKRRQKMCLTEETNKGIKYSK